MLVGVDRAPSLPNASSLCGACYEVCPVKINIPEVLVHLRRRVVESRGGSGGEAVAMRAMGRVFGSRRLYEAAQRAGRVVQRPLVRRGRIRRLPGLLSGWTSARDLPAVPGESFRDWWRARG
jgi:L-lactate dehydrogenase complex protein LldF